MVIGTGYFIGAVVLLLYSIFCYYVGLKRPEKLIRIVKLKIGKNSTDDRAAKFCVIWATLVLIAGIVVIVLGYVNA